MLEGKLLNLRIVEKEDLSLLSDWLNNLEFTGRQDPLGAQQSKAEIEKKFDKLNSEKKWFFIEKKDTTKIGFIGTRVIEGMSEIGYAISPAERRKGYCTEAVKLMIDYLFLSKDIVRIQAATNTKNKASQKVLEKAGFQKEGTLRKSMFVWGNWDDLCLYGILREEWKKKKNTAKPKSLMTATSH